MNKEPVVGKYILVHPYELADIPNPGFPWKGRSEEDVRDFLSDQRVQNYFLSFNEDDPTFHKAYMVDNTDLTFVFTDFYAPRYCGHPVSVVKTPDGYAHCTDGRHRLYVTKSITFLS